MVIIVTASHSLSYDYYRELQQAFHIGSLQWDKMLYHNRHSKRSAQMYPIMKLFIDCMKTRMELSFFIEEIRSW